MPGAGTPAEEPFRAGVSSPVPLPGGSHSLLPLQQLQGWAGRMGEGGQ